jgi:hypothetical protein
MGESTMMAGSGSIRRGVDDFSPGRRGRLPSRRVPGEHTARRVRGASAAGYHLPRRAVTPGGRRASRSGLYTSTLTMEALWRCS